MNSYLAPVKTAIMERNEVTHKLILPAIKSEDRNTEQEEAMLSMMLGKYVCIMSAVEKTLLNEREYIKVDNSVPASVSSSSST